MNRIVVMQIFIIINSVFILFIIGYLINLKSNRAKRIEETAAKVREDLENELKSERNRLVKLNQRILNWLNNNVVSHKTKDGRKIIIKGEDRFKETTNPETQTKNRQEYRASYTKENTEIS